MQKNNDAICNPIYHFTESDIWEYIREFDVLTNPLYSKGFRRVGCIGCPMGGAKQQYREFNEYPKYKQNYIKAFSRMNEHRKEKNLKAWKNGEEVMRWWLGENINQVRIEDILEEEDDGNTDKPS